MVYLRVAEGWIRCLLSAALFCLWARFVLVRYFMIYHHRSWEEKEERGGEGVEEETKPKLQCLYTNNSVFKVSVVYRGLLGG